MLKGYQRKLIMIRTADSSVFESAFFIIKGERQEKYGGSDLVFEANRILAQGEEGQKKSKTWKLRHIFISASIGFFSGAFIMGLLWLLCYLTK